MPGGRLVLDVYHRGFFERHQGERLFEIADVPVREEKRMDGNRLRVVLKYSDSGEGDEFDWRVYYPEELVDELSAFGFHCIASCTEFDESCSVTNDYPRMQMVFELRAEK